MAAHYDDEAELEQLKQWWNENWKALAAGLALGLGGIFGWQAWQGHELKVAGQASQAYEDLRKAADQNRPEEARKLGDTLMRTYADTPYAAQAALRLAQLDVAEGKHEEASTRLGWVIEHGGDEGLRHVARLRQARVLWQLTKADEALKVLDVAEPGSFSPLYGELRGDIKLSMGDRTGAAEEYRKVRASPEAGSPELQQKLDDLTDVPLADAKAAS